MKFHTLLIKLVEVCCLHCDKDVMIRICKRDKEGGVTHIKEIPISYLLTARAPIIAIEEETITNTPFVEMKNNLL